MGKRKIRKIRKPKTIRDMRNMYMPKLKEMIRNAEKLVMKINCKN